MKTCDACEIDFKGPGVYCADCKDDMEISLTLNLDADEAEIVQKIADEPADDFDQGGFGDGGFK